MKHTKTILWNLAQLSVLAGAVYGNPYASNLFTFGTGLSFFAALVVATAKRETETANVRELREKVRAYPGWLKAGIIAADITEAVVSIAMGWGWCGVTWVFIASHTHTLAYGKDA